MDHNQNKWIDKVESSLLDIQRAKAPNGLFEKINSRLQKRAPQPTVINITLSVAAAMAILFVNAFVLIQFKKALERPLLKSELSIYENQSLISNYKIYE